MRTAIMSCSLLLGCAGAGLGRADGAYASVGDVAVEKNGVDVLAIQARLEAHISSGAASEEDRERAYARVQVPDDGTAAYAFARAAVAGRVAEVRGLSATKLVRETEAYARLSLDRDPEFRRGAARRMLGTLYVMAPNLVRHGDSEDGLELLERQVDRYPDDPANHLRLAEGYLALGDPEAARQPLCQAAMNMRRSERTAEQQRLLRQLLEEIELGRQRLCHRGDGS
ncbi:MAG: tetratricopeptide repeat protein [Nannocystaceae bacterium]